MSSKFVDGAIKGSALGHIIGGGMCFLVCLYKNQFVWAGFFFLSFIVGNYIYWKIKKDEAKKLYDKYNS